MSLLKNKEARCGEDGQTERLCQTESLEGEPYISVPLEASPLSVSNLYREVLGSEMGEEALVTGGTALQSQQWMVKPFPVRC